MKLRWIDISNSFTKSDHYSITLNFELDSSTSISKNILMPKSVLYQFIKEYSQKWGDNDNALNLLKEVEL